MCLTLSLLCWWSWQVRLAIAEKGLLCEEYDVSLPLSEHNEPWFMNLNPTGEVPVLVHDDSVICDPTQIVDYLDQNFSDGEASSTGCQIQHGFSFIPHPFLSFLCLHFIFLCAFVNSFFFVFSPTFPIFFFFFALTCCSHVLTDSPHRKRKRERKISGEY